MYKIMPIGTWFFDLFKNNTNIVEDIMTSESEEQQQHKTIESLVNMILTQDKFTLKKIFTDKIKKYSVEEIQPVDEFRPLSDQMTQFVVSEFFPSNIETEHFIKIVYGTFDDALKLYKSKKNLQDQDIFFVYKGGNILRYVAYEVMHEIGGQVANNIDDYYKDSFKKSDADFSIYVSPNLDNYDAIYNDINILAYLLQTYLRDYFTKNQEKCFAFYKLNENEKHNILKKYLDKLNESDLIKNKNPNFNGQFTALTLDNFGTDINGNPTNLEYVPSPDFSIDYQLYNQQVTEKIDLKCDKSIYRISSNQTLRFKNGSVLIRFGLVRTKVIFNAHFTSINGQKMIVHLGGELIDVSVPHREDKTVSAYFAHLKDKVNEYHINSSSGKFAFKAPSLQYLTEDIENVLFRQRDFPWNDVKYGKRLKRLLFMYFIALLINTNMTYNDKINYLIVIQQNIFAKLINTSSNNQDIINMIDTFINEHPNQQKYSFGILLLKIKDILQIPNYNKDKLTELSKVAYDNISTLIGFFKMIVKKSNMAGLSANNILDGNVLWGGFTNYKNKYLKYKMKYLQEKKNKY